MEIQTTWIQKFNHKDAKDNSFGRNESSEEKISNNQENIDDSNEPVFICEEDF